MNMHEHSTEQTALARRIGLRLTERSLAPQVRNALRSLGYSLIDLDSEPEAEALSSRVWIVDEERLDELPSIPQRPELQVALLCESAESQLEPPEDERVFSRITRPARLTTVYEMLQTVLEGTPRRLPRVPTKLSARCIRDEHRSMGAVLSLSEGGCLLRSSDGFARGAQIDLQFALPQFGLIKTHAECRYAQGKDLGLAFGDAHSETRRTIAHYVTSRLAAGRDESSMPNAVGF